MENIRTLKVYQERCFINSLLFERMMNHNIFIRNILNLPLIIISAILTILNSIMEEKDMKIINIVLNGTVGLILSIMNNFKVADKIATFKNEKAKIIKLQHKIDTYLNTSLDVNAKDIEEIIAQYDTIIEEQEYPILDFIKKPIKKKYKHMNMPLSMLSIDSCDAELCCCLSETKVSLEKTEPPSPSAV